jgi:hypothetical protein
MRVRRLAIVDSSRADELWELYQKAFTPLARKAAERQIIPRDEFLADMRDARIWKYVGYDAEGKAIGLAVLTRHLETNPWINVEFFAHRWPREHEEGRIYYLGYILIDPAQRRPGLYLDLLRPMAVTLSQANAVMGFDVSQASKEVLSFLRPFTRHVRDEVVPQFVTIDAQAYYAVSFHHPGEAIPSLDGEVIDLTETAASRPKR